MEGVSPDDAICKRVLQVLIAGLAGSTAKLSSLEQSANTLDSAGFSVVELPDIVEQVAREIWVGKLMDDCGVIAALAHIETNAATDDVVQLVFCGPLTARRKA